MMSGETYIERVDVTPDRIETLDGFMDGFSVDPIWANVDRPNCGGYFVPADKPKLIERLRRAMIAGAVYRDPEVKTDVNGKTYVHARATVLGRMMNADLKRLGF